jgi:hypothetical protein
VSHQACQIILCPWSEFSIGLRLVRICASPRISSRRFKSRLLMSTFVLTKCWVFSRLNIALKLVRGNEARQSAIANEPTWIPARLTPPALAQQAAAFIRSCILATDR